MFFFFLPGYNILENDTNYDLDIFLYDNTKIIHLASGGMQLINSLRKFNIQSHDSNLRKVLAYRRIFNYESNEQLERNNLTTIENYFYSFNIMSKRGFFSYDKVDINNSNDYKFQLISKPTYNRKLIINQKLELGKLDSKLYVNYDLEFLPAKKDFPDNYKIFDLTEYV